MGLTAEDLQKFQSAHPALRMELVDGQIVVRSLSGYESAEVATRLAAQLLNWVDERRLGRVTGSGAGFMLSNGDIRTCDVSFVKAERLRWSLRSFAELAPDLMVEVKSPTDSLTKLEAKIESFLSLGTQVGILVNPEDRTVKIYRAGQEPILLRDGDRLMVPELLPEWGVAVTELWAPEFD